MSWTYRVVKEVLRGPKGAWPGRRDATPAQVYYTIREVYTNGIPSKTRYPFGVSATGVHAGGVTFAELQADYEKQGRALGLPVLVLEGETVTGEEDNP